MSTPEFAVHNNTAAHRYEIERAGETAFLTYAKRGETIIFLHTEVPPALEGHGLANQLAHTALEEAGTQHLMVVPSCPFVAAYIRRHPEYLSLLSPAEQAQLQQGL